MSDVEEVRVKAVRRIDNRMTIQISLIGFEPQWISYLAYSLQKTYSVIGKILGDKLKVELIDALIGQSDGIVEDQNDDI